MPSDLIAKRDAVCDERTFIEFLVALATDREDEVAKEQASPSSPWGAGANGWQNGTIEGFLGAASAWAEGSINGLKYYSKPENPWKRCADIIYMGKIYE